MKYLFYLLIVLTFVAIQCTNEIPVTTNPDTEAGKVFLRIDKETVPTQVVVVEAFLTRENHDSLYGELNLLDSVSADILFEGVAAGNWFLKVDAKDNEGVVLYTGSTELIVLAGILTQVNLTLIPTGSGAGSIYIVVNWGTASNWEDYANNPIFMKENAHNNSVAVKVAKVIRDGNIFKMWYTNLFSSAFSNIGYAESANGINWTSNLTPVLLLGQAGSWDSYGVVLGAVIKNENNYLMYYTGYTSIEGYWHIGLATSVDGINWSKYATPVLNATSNEPQVSVSSVVKIGSEYLMYYTVRNPNSSQFYKICLATSTDGINWVRNSSNPILLNNQSWEGMGIYHPAVIYKNSQFEMVYMNQQSNAFGMAASSDGINWTKSNSNPFFTKQETNNNWAYNFIGYPDYVHFDNEYRIYYTGGHGNQYNSSIGFMRKFGN